MVRCGAVVVVFDGLDRLQWKRITAGRRTPSGIWPNDSEAAEIAEVLERGEPLLVILDQSADPVPVLVEELRSAPSTVTDLVSTVEGDVAELRIPRLDWLPDQLRERGHRFLHQVSRDLARRPALLTPPLVLDEDGDRTTVRFGLRKRPSAWRLNDLPAAVSHVFVSAVADPVRGA
jgi:hypothetical protein